jgi:dolichyl-phosphate beta-glucosyltransferase
VLSVVMPAHNEAGYLETAVRDVDEGLRARGHDLEILVVENGTTDDTLDIGRRLADEFPSVRVSARAGADYGAALRDGIVAAAGSSSSRSTSTTTTLVSSTTRWRC